MSNVLADINSITAKAIAIVAAAIGLLSFAEEQTEHIRESEILTNGISRHDTDVEQVVSADVIVYGSTPAGIVAAIQAKRMGRSVVLISQRKRIGGMTTGGLGQVDIGNKSAYTGLALQFFRDVKSHYDDPTSWVRQTADSYRPEVWDFRSPTTGYEDTMWTFEPHVAEAILEKWIAEAAVTLVRGEWLDRGVGGVVKEKGRIVSIRTVDGKWAPTGKVYTGKVFLDCSYEGDLMAAAGVTYVVGRESNSVYGETLNGYQPQSGGHALVAGVDPYVTPGDIGSGILPGIRGYETVKDRAMGSGDGFVQAYNYRLCLTTTDQDNCIPFAAPAGYDASRYELLFRAINAGDEMKHKNECPMPNLKTDTNNDGGFSTDYIGASWEYPEASYERRAEIALDHLRYVQGLFYTLANDSRVSAETRALYVNHGVCSDEFVDSPYGVGWSDEIYVRESRRMVGAYVMTENNVRGSAVAPKEIARGSYGIDSHAVQRYVGADGYVHNEGNVQWQENLEHGKTYPIGYDAVTPKRADCENLLVAFCLSASHVAFGSIRMEPVLFEIGQACGAAAAIAVELDCAVQDVPYAELKERKYDEVERERLLRPLCVTDIELKERTYDEVERERLPLPLRVTDIEIDDNANPAAFCIAVDNAQGVDADLIAAYGMSDGGDDPSGWDKVVRIDKIMPGASTFRAAAPTGYGTDWKCLRFFVVEVVRRGFWGYKALCGDGTAWIDTRRKGVTGDGYEISFLFESNDKDVFVMGARSAAAANNIAVLGNVRTSKDAYLDYANYEVSRMTAENGTVVKDVWYRAKLTSDLRSLVNLDKGTSCGSKDTSVDEEFETPENIRLFSFGGNPPGGYANMTGLIGEYIVTTDGGSATNQHFVATKSVDGSKIGFYDRISHGFFGNAAGTGAFTVVEPTGEYFEDEEVPDEKDVLTVSALYPSEMPPKVKLGLTDASVSSNPIYSPVLSYEVVFGAAEVVLDEVDLFLAWGEGGDLSNTNFIETIAAPGGTTSSRTYANVKLTSGKRLSVALVAKSNGLLVGASSELEVSTLGLEPRKILKAKVNRTSEGVATSVSLRILADLTTNALVAAYGRTDGGTDKTAWDRIELVQMVRPEETDCEWAVPANAEDIKYVRFFLMDGSSEFRDAFYLYKALRGDGSAWIDTRRKGVTGDGYEITFLMESDDKDVFVMGARSAAAENNIAVLANITKANGKNALIDYANYKVSRMTAENGTVVKDVWYRAKLTKDLRSLVNLDTGISCGAPNDSPVDEEFETPENIRLFSFGGNPPGGYANMTGLIGEYIVTTDGGSATNQHFVAAKSADGSKIGFYDLADGNPETAWHENQGSGAFAVYGEPIGKIHGNDLTGESKLCELRMKGLIICIE